MNSASRRERLLAGLLGGLTAALVALTVGLVLVVIFCGWRRFVACVMPAPSLPVALVRAGALLWGWKYRLEYVSLLGLTLAVGLVVDDAIVML